MYLLFLNFLFLTGASPLGEASLISIPGHKNLGTTRALEDEVTSFLEDLGFYVWEWTYHSHLPLPVTKMLARNDSPTALFIRTKSDRVAIGRNFVFLWEAKTVHSPRHQNLAIEALPLARYLALYDQFSVETLYVFRNPHSGLEGGFWVSDLPNLSCLIIPESKQAEWFEKKLSPHFPGVPIRYVSSVQGSGDPFVIVPQTELKKLADWRDLILSKMRPH